MKLQQLRYVVEVFRRNLNVSEAADALFTSQPGVSKQIRLLEDELGVQIFIRSGKRIVAVTPAGLSVLEMAEQVLRHVQNIKHIGDEFSDAHQGVLNIAATHHVARFRLQAALKQMAEHYPDVQLSVRQSTPAQMAEWVRNGEVDFAIGQDMPTSMNNLKLLPCGTWRYGLLVPAGHDLCRLPAVAWSDLAAHPLLAYSFAFQSTSSAARAALKARMHDLHIALESDDAQLLKDYARFGLGVALIDAQAYLPEQDGDLVLLDVAALFEPTEYHVALREDALLRHYQYDFLQWLHPDLTHDRVRKLLFAPAVEDFSI